MYCSKNTGRVHTKWSPVSTVFYRLMPHIQVSGKVKGKDAHDLKEICPMNVFGVDKKDNLTIEDLKSCTMCRECIREDRFNDKIELGKDRNHYIFTIESIGAIAPEKLFSKALAVLKEKVQHYLIYLKSLKEKNK